MQLKQPAELVALIRNCLAAGGFSQTNSEVVALHLVDAEMKGVASHGINRLGLYLSEAAKDVIDAEAQPVVTHPRDGVVHVDGARGIGIVAMAHATEALVEEAGKRSLAVAGVVNCGHSGRMGAYAEQAAAAGFLAMSFGGGGRRKWGNVVPFGGVQPVMSTNPYTLALPGLPHDPVVADFAISTLATGKVAVARANGELLPPDAVIDRAGNPTCDPEDYYAGGALLPAAGPKGSGLGIIAEMMGDAMLGDCVEYNWLMVLVRADVFQPMAEYQRRAEGFVEEVRNSKTAPGVERVLMPGERETALAAEADREGIRIGDGVWAGIVAAAASVGIEA
ncbi:MAG: Ldh family oxidoreductase [Chromatiales bacterium]|nr:Ldh family oxidoreductase [Chromatiales bacterium]